jgi:DNA (cytosine-5)-methyltransferase 1/tRNA (cytosine38-C5)-methyltransferase
MPPEPASIRTSPFRAIEFFSGVGGWRYALGEMGNVVAAYDISEVANAVYSHNFGDSPIVRELATVGAKEIISLGANAWLMSPPCQPFCRMGETGGLKDARSAAFLRLMDLLTEIRPEHFVLENVEGFLESDAYALLAQKLDEAGLRWRSFSLCPTQFGIPNRRPRVYVVASVNGVSDATPPSIEPNSLDNYLDPEADGDEDLYIAKEEVARHGPGLDIVGSESKRSACFIGGYGKRFVGSGSFLETPKGIRRFSPMEISRLMGYPPSFGFPDGVPLVKQYKLLGNGLNIEVAKWAVERLRHLQNSFRAH